MELKRILVCSCCGGFYEGEQGVEHDQGFGVCPKCDGWVYDRFMDTRINMLLKNLNSDTAMELKSLEREKQEYVVIRLIEEGVII